MTDYEKLSLVISGVALFVALASFILNIIYTKRKFESSVYPKIRIWLGLEPYMGDGNSGMSMIRVHLTNLSDRLHIINTKVSLRFSDPFSRVLHPHMKRWVPYASGRGSDVPPGGSGSVSLDEHGSIEEFLARSFSNRLIKKVPRNRINGFFFQLVKDEPIELTVKVEYGVSVEGTGQRAFTRRYSVAPINGGEDKLVTSWEIREVFPQ